MIEIGDFYIVDGDVKGVFVSKMDQDGYVNIQMFDGIRKGCTITLNRDIIAEIEAYKYLSRVIKEIKKNPENSDEAIKKAITDIKTMLEA